jgi:hypothetical protein
MIRSNKLFKRNRRGDVTSNLPGRTMIRPEDRREHRRERPTNDARLQARFGEDEVDCSVIDLSRGGAKLRFSHVPEGITEFVISHDKVGELRGECVWRGGDYIGVRLRSEDIERFMDELAISSAQEPELEKA